ncbi:MAG: hypothetical protein HY718_18815 [Planctomycetes bacterium]|nr:hypothetical protein [Planctomycetota bacterium]
MILTLRVECVFGLHLENQCIRVIEIDEQMSLYDLHDAIQDAVGFDRDHPFAFFVANSASPFARRRWLTDAEGWDDQENYFRNTRLSDVYPLNRKHLYYLFDFGDDWTFEIRRGRRANPPEDRVRYPRVVSRTGPNPQQYPNIDGW